MTTPYGERRNPEPTPVELARLRAIPESIAEELPDLVARDQLRRAAARSGRSAGPCGTRFTGELKRCQDSFLRSTLAGQGGVAYGAREKSPDTLFPPPKNAA